ncbi:unnamed protein product, partial [Cyprideis torosa]
MQEDTISKKSRSAQPLCGEYDFRKYVLGVAILDVVLLFPSIVILAFIYFYGFSEQYFMLQGAPTITASQQIVQVSWATTIITTIRLLPDLIVSLFLFYGAATERKVPLLVYKWWCIFLNLLALCLAISLLSIAGDLSRNNDLGRVWALLFLIFIKLLFLVFVELYRRERKVPLLVYKWWCIFLNLLALCLAISLLSIAGDLSRNNDLGRVWALLFLIFIKLLFLVFVELYRRQLRIEKMNIRNSRFPGRKGDRSKEEEELLLKCSRNPDFKSSVVPSTRYSPNGTAERIRQFSGGVTQMGSTSREPFAMESGKQQQADGKKGVFLSRGALWGLAAIFIFSLIVAILVTRHVSTKDESLTKRQGTEQESEEISVKKVYPNVRLPRHLEPINYRLELMPFPFEGNFTIKGRVQVDLKCVLGASNITLHALDLDIDDSSIRVSEANSQEDLLISRTSNDSVRQFFIIHLKQELQAGKNYTVRLEYVAQLADSLSGFYRGKYSENNETR